MKNFIIHLLLCTFAFITLTSESCTGNQVQATSDSGVKKASVKVETDADGHTSEQVNVIKRNKRDNQVGAIKYLYQISAYTGEVIAMSTVRGKVTSGGKRLSPTTVNNDHAASLSDVDYNTVIINGRTFVTDELPDEYGTYGNSMPFLYWFDENDNYKQLYISGGVSVEISESPLRIRNRKLELDLNVRSEIPYIKGANELDSKDSK